MQYKEQYRLNPKDQWETDEDTFEILDKVFDFTVDAAATMRNAKCERYWDIEDNGLEQSWSGETVFCNPPHTNGAYAPWIAKAYEEFKKNYVTSVMVLPFNSETKGFRPVWKYAHYLIRPYSRLKYTINGKKMGSPPFDSCVAVFTYDELKRFDLGTLSSMGYVIDLNLGLYPGYVK